MQSTELNFNPRTREWCDFGGSNYDSLVTVSIHAPARGATLFYLPPLARFFVSIHAPARGATANDMKTTKLISVSIHAPARGATKPGLGEFKMEEFQSTHPRGVRQCTAIP